MSPQYDHPGNLWTEHDGHTYCDRCWAKREEDAREEFLDYPDYGRPPKGGYCSYVKPFAHDVCCDCGVVASEQHEDEG